MYSNLTMHPGSASSVILWSVLSYKVMLKEFAQMIVVDEVVDTDPHYKFMTADLYSKKDCVTNHLALLGWILRDNQQDCY